MFSVLTRVEGEMRFFEGVPPSPFLPSLLPPFPVFSSALTYNGCPATDPRLDPEGKISVFLSARGPSLPLSISPLHLPEWKRFFTASRRRLTLRMGSDSRRVPSSSFPLPLSTLLRGTRTAKRVRRVGRGGRERRSVVG